MVEEGNLFDPERPSLGSGLEALHQHLEALSLGPDTRESRLDRPAGMCTVGWAVCVCVEGARATGSAELETRLGDPTTPGFIHLKCCSEFPGHELMGLAELPAIVLSCGTWDLGSEPVQGWPSAVLLPVQCPSLWTRWPGTRGS